MSINKKLELDLKNMSNQLSTYELNLNTSKDMLSSYAQSANGATSKGIYNTFTELYNQEKENFNSLLSDYESLGGTYSQTLEKYKTMSFSQSAEIIKYELPNPKNENEWLAGGTFYNEKNPGGYVWSAINPLSPDERVKQDLGLVINRGNFNSYLNEGFTEIQNTLHGFGFLDLLNDNIVSQTNVYEVTVTITSSDGSINTESKYINEGSGDLDSTNISAQRSATISEISGILNARGLDLTSVNSIGGVLEFTIESIFDGKTFESGSINLGNMIAASLMNTTTNALSQKLSMAVVSALGVTNVIAIGLISLGVKSLAGEMLEVAMGIDSQFGYGGDFIATDVNGRTIHATIEGNFFERSGTAINDTFGELGGMLSGNGYTSATEQATYDSLSLGITDALNQASISLSGLAVAKALDKYSELDKELNKTLDEMSLESQIEYEVDEWVGNSGSGNDGTDYGSSNNPSGGVGASGYGPDGPGGFGGGM